jgi:hypothetical protein
VLGQNLVQKPVSHQGKLGGIGFPSILDLVEGLNTALATLSRYRLISSAA